MARSRSRSGAAVFFLVAVAVAAAAWRLPAASADACTDECHKTCGPALKKGEGASSCAGSCDEKCRIKAAAKHYDAAAPAESKGAAGGELRVQSVAGVGAALTDERAANLATSCVNQCYDRCGPQKTHQCTSRCVMVCRTEVESLSFAADMYISATPAQRAIVVAAVDKQAQSPEGKIAVLSAPCISQCSKSCNNPKCVDICNDGCYAKAVSVAFATAPPLMKDAISRDIDNAQPQNKHPEAKP